MQESGHRIRISMRLLGRNGGIMKAHQKLLSYVAAIAITTSLGTALTPSAFADEAPPISCQSISTEVKLDVLIPATVRGELCTPTGQTPSSVQLLIHGATYDRNYWDFPYQPEKYSYADAANARGISTFNIDRVGYGTSSKVPSLSLTAQSQANVIHQLVQKLRRGDIGNKPFQDVILVGHSVGSGIATLAAATYHDVQGVILTGMTHHVALDTTVAAFTVHTHPALLDPKFAGKVFDPGYITTKPGQRDDLFYGPGDDADPGVVARDEELKETVSATELGEAITLGFTVPTSLNIKVPVLLVNGSEDALFCSGLLAGECSSSAELRDSEAFAFSPAAQLEAFVLPGAGHDINLSTKAAQWHSVAFDWHSRRF